MIDRALQRAILARLRDAYPDGADVFAPPLASEDATLANLHYLGEHGLCETGVKRVPDEHVIVGPARIKAAGLDFLADDGGLTAILGAVTIRLEAETLKALFAARVDGASIPPEEKSRIKQHLGRLSEAALKAAIEDLMKQGLARMPDAIGWLRTLAPLG